MPNFDTIMSIISTGLFGYISLRISNIFNIIRYYVLRNCSAEGKIIKIEKPAPNSPLYRNVVVFKIGDKEITAQSEQLVTHAEALSVGTPVLVKFRASNPEKTALFGIPLRFNFFYFLFGIIFILATINTIIESY